MPTHGSLSTERTKREMDPVHDVPRGLPLAARREDAILSLEESAELVIRASEVIKQQADQLSSMESQVQSLSRDYAQCQASYNLLELRFRETYGYIEQVKSRAETAEALGRQYKGLLEDFGIKLEEAEAKIAHLTRTLEGSFGPNSIRFLPWSLSRHAEGMDHRAP